MSGAAIGSTRLAGGRWRRARGWLMRLGGLGAVAVGLVVCTFLMVRLIPGDPARGVLGMSSGQEQVEQVREQLGLNGSIATQFGDYVSGLVRGDLGTSFETSESVSDVIAEALPYTLELVSLAVVLVFLVGVSLGMTVAVLARDGRRRWLDGLFQGGTSIGGAFPEYVAGTLLVLLCGIWLGVLPVAGADSATSVVLPVLAVSLAPACTLARIVRRETAGVLRQDYMRTAHGKRLPPPRLYLRHALPNVMTSALGYAGLLLAALLGGTVVVENVFAWPGLGTRLVHAIGVRDYPVIQGSILVLGMLAVIATMAVDVALRLIDPRREARP